MATKIAFFDTKSYDRETFNKVNLQFGFDITYFKERLSMNTVSSRVTISHTTSSAISSWNRPPRDTMTARKGKSPRKGAGIFAPCRGGVCGHAHADAQQEGVPLRLSHEGGQFQTQRTPRLRHVWKNSGPRRYGPHCQGTHQDIEGLWDEHPRLRPLS